MNFADLKKNLKTEIKNNYLLIGGDMFLRSKAYALVADSLQLTMPDFNSQVFDGEEIDFNVVVDACNVMPMLDEHRLVYVNVSIQCKVQNINKLADYLAEPNESTVLVVNAGENTKDLDKYKEKFELVDCSKITENLIGAFVAKELSKYGKTITPKALSLLISYTSADMSRIDTETTKLVSYVGDREAIDEQDVMLMVPKSIDFQIYELTEALAKKNAKKVYEILEVLRAKKDSYRTIIGLIYNHFRRLFHVSISKLSKPELAQLLGVKEFAVGKYESQAKLFGAKNLKYINDLCMRLDMEVKQSETNVDSAVEYLVLTILNI